MTAVPIGQSRPVAGVLARLQKVRALGGNRGWTACCPAHEDRNPSLSITEGRDGRVLVNCHANCSTQAILAAIGLTMRDLFADDGQRPVRVEPDGAAAGRRPRLVRTYDYVDGSGELVFQVCRFEPKTFKQRRPDGHGDWIYNLDGVARVLYRLPDVEAAVASGRPVFVVEGEKDVESLVERGYTATTIAGGAKSWRDDYAAALAGATVFVLPDNDDAGRTFAESVAAACVAQDCVVKLVDLPGLGPKGDVTDWLGEGHTIEEFEQLLAAAPIWRPRLHRVWRRLDEVLDDPEAMQPPRAVVRGVAFASRSSVLVAREKHGKSTLAGYMASRVSTGRPCFDEPVVTGRVLVIGLEEFIGDTARRLRHFGADPEGVFLVEALPGAPGERTAEIEKLVAELRPVLVIVDSLLAFVRGAVKSTDDAAQMQPLVQGLTDLAHRAGIALVILAHAKKGQDGGYHGSIAIGAGVDVIAEMTTPDEKDPTRRKLTLRGRVPLQDFEVCFDGDTFATIAPAGFGGATTETALEERILAFVRTHPSCALNTVIARVRGKTAEVTRATHAMLDSGALVNLGTSSAWKLCVPDQPTPLFAEGR